MFLSIGVDFPEANTFVSFNNRIAYAVAPVNYSNLITDNAEKNS